MKHITIALATCAALWSTGSNAQMQDGKVSVSVDADAFKETPRTLRKRGITVGREQLRPIVPGVEKDTVYNLIGTPHFGEGITRRWNYVVFVVDGQTTARCRLRLDFAKPMRGAEVAVQHITWSSQQCMDLAAR